MTRHIEFELARVVDAPGVVVGDQLDVDELNDN